MTARRALVVDDSRSARAFLTRILERYELAVDAVESAEQAIEYLTQQRPDVIFMDHLMPGMDGFQAVQAIKNNPRTATIPIMMYTSQEGELYLSQARALGAIGVLPKQIKHADVSKALEQLRLRPEPRPGSDTPTVRLPTLPTDAAPPQDLTREQRLPETALERRGADRPPLPALPAELRTILEAMLAHHGRELRRFVVDNLESQADRIVGDVRMLLQDSLPEPAAPAVSVGRAAAPWLAAAGVAGTALFLLLWWALHVHSQALTVRLVQAQQQLAVSQSSLAALRAADAAAAAAASAASRGDIGAGDTPAAAGAAVHTDSLIEPVPFDEVPLAGARVERVSALLAQLAAQNFRGVVQIRSFPGRYCMISGSSGAPALPADTLPYAKCDQIGNPLDDEDSVSARQSIAFADMISTARTNAAGRFDIQISAGGPDEVATPYPAVGDGLTAGEWNRAAAANNRVELRWQAGATQ